MKLILAFLCSVIVTGSIFAVMSSMVSSDGAQNNNQGEQTVIDFIRLKQDETVQKKERKPQKPPTPKEPPPQMQQPQMQQANPNTNAVSTSFTADVQTDSGLSGGLNLESADGDYLPIVKVAPIYPRRAQSRGIEGYVIVEFTVTKNGSVRNPLVIESQPEGIFDRAAMDAALKFKYKPRVVDGVATEVAGVQNKISFEIDG